MKTTTTVLAILLVVACQEANTQQEPAADDAQQQSSVRPSAPVSGVQFDTASAQLVAAGKTVPIHVEIAARADQRAFGLMDRDSLAANSGMIFLYEEPQPASSGFWMYRTRIPLDIAFFDTSGKIVSIVQMQPCRSLQQDVCSAEARDYKSTAPYFGALEMDLNFFSENGIAVGDRIVLPGRVGG